MIVSAIRMFINVLNNNAVECRLMSGVKHPAVSQDMVDVYIAGNILPQL